MEHGSIPVVCALRRRSIPVEKLDDPGVVQTHHLRPEKRETSSTVDLCRPRHDQIHAVFTNAELRGSFDTIAALRGADRLAGYLSWIRSTAKLDVSTETSDHVR